MTAAKDIIDAPAKTRVSYTPELIALLIYGAMLLVMVPRHEPWTDEAQAWQLARSLPYFKMMSGFLGYEGAPGLWHTLLWILAHAGGGYAAMHWMTAAIAFAGIAVFLFSSPFPRYANLAFPFTYYLAYQYSIVARSYVLFPLILFLVLWLWHRRSQYPIVFALLLGLMANISLHTAMISVGLIVICAFESWRDGVRLADLWHFQWVAPILIVGGLYALAIVVAKPPADNASLLSNPVWTSGTRALPLARLFAVACGPSLTDIPLFNLFFWAVLLITFVRFENPIYLAPVVLFFAFSCAVFAALWHYGILYLAVVAIFWITWERPFSPGRIILYALFLIGSCQQLAWTVSADVYDYSNAYSADPATASFLRPYVESGDRIAAVGGLPSYSVGMQPYFDRNIYFDQKYAFWWWSTQNHSATNVEAAIKEAPDILVVIGDSCTTRDSESRCVSPYTPALSAAGYTILAVFCGAKAEGFRVSTPMCNLVYGRRNQR